MGRKKKNILYHVNPDTLEVGECNAEENNCPFGGSHFKTEKEAIEYRDKIGDRKVYFERYSILRDKLENDKIGNITLKNDVIEDTQKILRFLIKINKKETERIPIPTENAKYNSMENKALYEMDGEYLIVSLNNEIKPNQEGGRFAFRKAGQLKRVDTNEEIRRFRYMNKKTLDALDNLQETLKLSDLEISDLKNSFYTYNNKNEL